MSVRRVFRFSFWYLWSRLSLLSIVLIIIATSIAQFGNGGRLFGFDHLTFIALIGGIMSIFAVPGVLAHIRYFSVVADAEGIEGNTARGKRRRLAWSELGKLRRVRHIGVPCYSFHSKQNDIVLIVPICLKQQTDFDVILEKHGVRVTDEEAEVEPSQPGILRRSRPTITPIREGGYIVVTTEQRGLKSR